MLAFGDSASAESSAALASQRSKAYESVKRLSHVLFGLARTCQRRRGLQATRYGNSSASAAPASPSDHAALSSSLYGGSMSFTSGGSRTSLSTLFETSSTYNMLFTINNEDAQLATETIQRLGSWLLISNQADPDHPAMSGGPTTGGASGGAGDMMTIAMSEEQALEYLPPVFQLLVQERVPDALGE